MMVDYNRKKLQTRNNFFVVDILEMMFQSVQITNLIMKVVVVVNVLLFLRLLLILYYVYWHEVWNHEVAKFPEIGMIYQ